MRTREAGWKSSAGLGDKLRIAVTIQTPAIPPGEPVAA